MPALLAAWRTIRSGSTGLAAQEQRNFIEIQTTGEFQRNAQHKRLAPRSGPGEVLARRGRLTKFPAVSAKVHREVQ